MQFLLLLRRLLIMSLIASPSKGEQNLDVADEHEHEHDEPARIVGGDEATEHQFPWIVSIQVPDVDACWMHACGGSILTDKWIVTAAHCVTPEGVYRVVAGEHDLSDKSDAEQVVGVAKTFRHPQYKTGHHENDIGLIKLAKALKMNENVANIYISNSKYLDSPPKRALVAGWGFEDAEGKGPDPVDKLQKVWLDYVTHEDCVKDYPKYPFDLTSATQVCYGDKGKSSCHGDSGGPLVHYLRNPKGEVHAHLYGVVSYGHLTLGCKAAESIYTKVPAFMTWILETVINHP